MIRFLLPLLLGLGAAAPVVAADVIRHEGSRLVCERGEGEEQDAAKAQTACLAETKGVVTRSGDVLVVGIVGGKSVRFASNPKACANDDAENCRIVRLAAFDPARSFAIVEEILYEGGAVQLVDLRDGSKVDLLADPEFSPSGALAVAVIADLMNAPDFEILLYDLTTQPFKRLHAAKAGTATRLAGKKGDVAQFAFEAWQGEDRVVIRLGDGEAVFKRLALTRDGARWRLIDVK